MRYLGLILAMMVVTFLPRGIPYLLVGRKRLRPSTRRFFTFLPVCALGALLVPGAWNAIPGRPISAIAGTVAAAIAAYFKGGLIISVLVGVGTSYLALAINLP